VKAATRQSVSAGGEGVDAAASAALRWDIRGHGDEPVRSSGADGREELNISLLASQVSNRVAGRRAVGVSAEQAGV